MSKKKDTPRADFYRIQATMPPEMVEWLESIGRECKKGGGYKISKCEVIRACIEAVRTASKKLEFNEIKTEDELKDCFLQALQKGKSSR